ncbi:hypothetical protein EJV47_13395 [Hymenobacter gummosus]|uniref:Uncharacterized protein n=1 Tax=Hymenobacter gummosus TaxID=1776032 RepID=A0A431U1U4_9BACT|nr:hypothetical protein [Hymenobacter gummosus]RTQ49139.1 hypothetical protein EJV47_13395 [Hymenobacter gummosus]
MSYFLSLLFSLLGLTARSPQTPPPDDHTFVSTAQVDEAPDAGDGGVVVPPDRFNAFYHS